ncbi:MAG: alpha/beta fold hydrolase [Bryobacteraceae bacterium]
MRRVAVILAFAGTVVAGVSIFLVETAFHLAPRYRPAPETAPGMEVSVTASDGAVLRGALYRPPASNGKAVLLLHGAGDSRRGMDGFGRFFAANGYLALAADSRGHGVSGGDAVTYGIHERGDVRRWADFLARDQRAGQLFGLGESMGAAILIQSLAVENRFRALVAECSFSTFREAAAERIPRLTGLPRFAGWPLLEAGFLYARARYGVDLEAASPEAVLRNATTPVLLIHGLADTRTAPAQSRALHAANPRYTELWEVPGAGHTRASLVAAAEFQRRVLAWFSR